MARRCRGMAAVVALVCSAAACTAPVAPDTSAAHHCASPEQTPATALTEVAYGSGSRQIADVYPACTAHPKGTIIVVHGGGYTSGSKSDARKAVYQRLRNEGWVLVAIDYRLAPANPWPAQPNDVQRAIDWWRGGAAEAIGAPIAPLVGMGWSAGGHLVEHNTVRDDVHGFDASISIGGATYWPDRATSSSAIALFGVGAPTYLLRSASTAPHVDATDPPLLHVHGMTDVYVSADQAVTLRDAIAASGDPTLHRVTLVPGCGHSSDCLSPAMVDPFLASVADA